MNLREAPRLDWSGGPATMRASLRGETGGRVNRMVKVQVKSNEPLDKALRRLRKICNNEGITREMKRASVYEKPSERRRRKQRERLKAIRLASRR